MSPDSMVRGASAPDGPARDASASRTGATRIARPGLSFWSDHLLHVWECPHVLNLPGGNPEYVRCGYLSIGPGECPYDHGESVQLVEIVAVVLCSDCGEQVMRDDSRTDDDRLICGQCAFQYIGRGTLDGEHGGQQS